MALKAAWAVACRFSREWFDFVACRGLVLFLLQVDRLWVEFSWLSVIQRHVYGDSCRKFCICNFFTTFVVHYSSVTQYSVLKHCSRRLLETWDWFNKREMYLTRKNYSEWLLNAKRIDIRSYCNQSGSFYKKKYKNVNLTQESFRTIRKQKYFFSQQEWNERKNAELWNQIFELSLRWYADWC